MLSDTVLMYSFQDSISLEYNLQILIKVRDFLIVYVNLITNFDNNDIRNK